MHDTFLACRKCQGRAQNNANETDTGTIAIGRMQVDFSDTAMCQLKFQNPHPSSRSAE